MSYTRVKNIYQTLGVDELGEPSTTQLGRKAIKKLREVDALMQKSNPTAEEREKIANKKYWTNVLHPEEDKSENKPTAKDLKKQAEKEKRRKRNEEKNNQKFLQAQQEQEERMKREQEREQAREQARQEARARFESQRGQRELDNVLGPFHKNPIALMIYNEYITISNAQTHKFAFRKLSMKYHPDKNHKKDTTLHQQILHHIYETMTNK